MKPKKRKKPVIITTIWILFSLEAAIGLGLAAPLKAGLKPPTPEAAAGLVEAFPIILDDLKLERLAQPFSPWDKAGRRFAFIGFEAGSLEAWAYPLKLVRNFELSFLIGSSTQPIRGRDIVRRIITTPAATILSFTYQSFTVRAIFIASINEPGGLILLDIATDEPLTVVVSFLPVLQPMWPAGLGGQYAYWDQDLKAYLISEPTRKNQAYVGSPAAEGISYTPAHMLSDAPSEFIIRLHKPEEAKGKFILIAMAGGRGARKDIRQIYESLLREPKKVYLEAVEHYQRLRTRTVRVETPVQELNLALEWAKISLDNLLVNNPDLGYGMVAGLGPSGTGGRPGFGWFFGGDAFINSLALDSLGMTEEAQISLAFTQKWQRQDGKMAHELSQAAAYIDWFKDYPYAYIHGDTTPYFLVAMADYYEQTGDIDFIKKSWPALSRAFEWCLTTDEDNDGLMDNRKAGLGALEYGELTGIQTDIYLGAVWVRALQAMKKMAELLGEKSLAQKATTILSKALVSFEKFWEASLESYVYAFNNKGERVKELTPWPAFALLWEIGQTERRQKTLQPIFSSILSTDWGVRVLSTASKLYGPLNYNYGAIWPFITGFVAAAEFKHHFLPQAFPLLLATSRHFFDNSLGQATEVFSGSRYLWPQEAVPHQGFSATGFVLPLLRGLFGLESSFSEGRMKFSPQFPANWRQVGLDNVRLGQERYNFQYERQPGKVRLLIDKIKSPSEDDYFLTDRPKRQAEEGGKREYPVGGKGKAGREAAAKINRTSFISKPINLLFAPHFGPGVRIKEVKVNGQPAEFKSQATSQFSQVEVEARLEEKGLIEIYLEETVEVLPPFPLSQVGDEDKGLKILNWEHQGKELRLQVEGRRGQSYHLGLHRPDLIASVSGADLVADNLLITFSDSLTDGFLKKQIIIYLK